jgi:copper oxidase (laccase) domain-containing protein
MGCFRSYCAVASGWGRGRQIRNAWSRRKAERIRIQQQAAVSRTSVISANQIHAPSVICIDQSIVHSPMQQGAVAKETMVSVEGHTYDAEREEQQEAMQQTT